jgi:hypothetical protein
MRVMVLVKATKKSEAGILPSTQLLADMGVFNEKLAKAGVLLAGEGLHPSAKGARVKFSGTKRMVIDGPFTETKELLAGFWLWQVSSLQEAIEWLKQCPNPHDEDIEVEIRPVFESAKRLRPRSRSKKSGCGGGLKIEKRFDLEIPRESARTTLP